MKFEEALQNLERIVADLETGECSLEQALELYAQGVEMLKLCTRHLTEAEQKVEILLKEQRMPFELESPQ